ncbi:hypothetical protein AVEN_117990-1 [Araneus ventricosus]|uniref:Uncharacterized protein n=1 Tax=Araneus ventricosus TaxID=182803 RepID=A0A4Y2C874_ARAVE|nr:hypothetical protein AVEN_117990-1 [Araneus ventricosus]
MMEPDDLNDINSLDDSHLNKNPFKSSKLSFHVPEGSCQQEKTEDMPPKNESGVIRRFIQAACFCSKERKKEDNSAVYVAYNPSFKPAP